MDENWLCLTRLQQISKEWKNIEKALDHKPWKNELWNVLIGMATALRGYELDDFCVVTDALMEAGFQSAAKPSFHYIDLCCQSAKLGEGESSQTDVERLAQAAANLLTVISKQGDGARVPALIYSLGDEKPAIRSRAASSLGEIGDAAAVPALEGTLDDEFAFVRRNVVIALGRIGEVAVVPALIKALADQDKKVRDKASMALSLVVDVSSIPALANALENEDKYVCRHVVAALGKIDDVKAVPVLINALKHEDNQVRLSAAAALEKLGDKAAAPDLIKLLTDEDRQIRKAGAAALGAIGDESAVPALIPLLEDEESTVRAAAAVALGELADPAAVPALSIALADKDSSVRRRAAMSLGTIGDEAAVPTLVKALEEKDWVVRVEIVRAVGRLSKNLVPADYHLCYQRIEMIAESDEFATINKAIKGTDWEEIIWSALLQICEWNKFAGRARLCADVTGLVAIGLYSPAAGKFKLYDQRCQERAQLVKNLPVPTGAEMAVTIGWLKSVIGLVAAVPAPAKGTHRREVEPPPATIPYGHWPQGDATLVDSGTDTIMDMSASDNDESADPDEPGTTA